MVDLLEQFRDWTEGRMWLYDQQGTVSWKQVCAVARYCSKEKGITHFFIDNLMKCVAGEDDYNSQKAFVDELCAIARDYDIHIHLVHHIKKPATDDTKPSKYDFKGTGAITDQPDNVIAVWRNKTKEKNRRDKKLVSETDPDAMLIVDKQRNGEWQPVTEQAEVNLRGTAATIRSTIASIEQLLQAAIRRQQTGMGDRVYVTFAPLS